MKKILSTLVMCLILGVGNVWADVVSGKATAVLYSNNTCQAEKGGWVAVLKGEVKNAPADNSSEWKRKTDFVSDATNGLRDPYAYVYMHARSEDGYYFAEWAQSYTSSSYTALSDGQSKDWHTNNSTDNPIYYYAGALSGTDGENIQRYAIFKPVTVDAMTIDGEAITSKTLNSTDKNGYKETTIVFTTAHADNWNDFVNDKVVLEGDSRFTIQSSNRNGNTVTVVVRFTDDDHHVLDGTLPSATVTLTSKGDATSKKTATITATSDLTPKFEFQDSPLDLTPGSPAMEEGVASTLITVAATGYENVVAAAEWSQAVFTDPEDAARKGFTLGTTTNTETNIKFEPTPYSMNQANVETEVCITATYKDANGNGKEIPYMKCVTITADAGKVITIGGEEDAVMDFGVIDYTETNVPVSIEYPIYSTLAATAFTKTETGFTTDISYVVNKFTGSGATDDKLTVTVNSTMLPNDYTATLEYKENVATDPIDASLLVKVSIKLAKPVVTATVPSGNVTLAWSPVYGANRYIIKVDGTELTTVETTTYDVTGLIAGRQYSFTVTAVSDAYPIGNRESDIVYATPGIPTEIEYSKISIIEMFTGTEKGAGDGGVYERFPYSKKRKIELNRIFDGEGTPLFDELYIFGLTTETDGTHDNINLPSAVLGCNATTPLYVYTKSGDKYVKTAEYDAVEKRFDHGADKNGKHLYFTGYCPFAYMGTKSTENGWMYFKGGQDATVDIYLDDCQIMGRYKTPTGANSSYIEYELILEADASKLGGEQANESFLQGNSSPFLFTSTSSNSGEPYKPTFHIADNNHLKGQLGSYITKTTGRVTILFVPITMDAGIGNIFTYSAPIAIKPQDLSTYTDLTLTDIWKDNTITNGYLRLDAQPMGNTTIEKVVAIDLGSANGSLTINGGQYHLRNSAADGTYTCNLAVGYRRFEKLVEKAGQKLLLHLYGFGGDMTDCKVTINSGTFTMYKNMYFNGQVVMGDSTFLGEDYYRDQVKFLDLRLPAGNGASQINGGTFNGITNVCMCTQTTTTGASPKNSVGYWLRLVDVPKANNTSYGSSTFQIPEEYINDGYYEAADPIYDITASDNLSKVAGGSFYGGQSANAYRKNDADVVTLLLPGDICEPTCKEQKEALIYQWATAIPVFDVTKKVSGADQSVQVGGSIHVKNSPAAGTTALDSITNQLLFLDAKGLEPYSMNLESQGAKLSLNDANMPRGRISNKESYIIEDHLNLLKVVQADTWYTFVAPYDVHQISVIEIDEGVISKKNRSEAVEHQAQSNWRIFYNLQDFILPNEQGRTTSLTLSALLAGSGAYILPLKHYDGTNVMSANYYLYKLANDVFGTDGTGDELDIAWTPVTTPETGNPILEKGKVYAMQFPWCPMCNDLASRTYYDYWSNKMILFYGAGGEHGQTIAGINSHSEIISNARPTTGATATLAGNPTFADMTLVAADNAYVHNMTNDYFELVTTSYTLKATEGFMLYNPGANPMPGRISRSGQMEYDENVETGVGGVPTVGDRTSLMLYGAYDGFELLSLCEQLVTVYNLQGNIIFQQYMAEGEQVYVATGAGVFIVRGESETIKVMVE